MPRTKDEVLLALPVPLRPMTRLRSTLLLASIESVRASGRFADYERALAPDYKQAVLGAIAGTWVSLDEAKAHYGACDALGLSPEQQAQAGRGTFSGARGTLLGTAVGLARGAGVTPWLVMPQLQRSWDRGCEGGGILVVRAGPKDAHVDLVQCALVSSPYFRHGLRGLVAGIVELFSSRAYVTERKAAGTMRAYYRVQWA
jgi:hypothetical protein